MDSPAERKSIRQSNDDNDSDGGLSTLFGSGSTSTTISKTVGGRFGGLEIRDVENAGGDAHFDDNTTICPDKDEFDYAYAYYWKKRIDDDASDEHNDECCHEESQINTNKSRDRRRNSEISSLSSGTAFGASRYYSDSRLSSRKQQPAKSPCSALPFVVRECSHPVATTQRKQEEDAYSNSYSHPLAHDRCTASIAPSRTINKCRRMEEHDRRSLASTNDMSTRSEGFGTYVQRYYHNSRHKKIILLVVFTAVGILVCFTAIVIDDFKNKATNGNANGFWSKHNGGGEFEESRQSNLPDEEFADTTPSYGPTLLPTPAPFRNIFEAKPYSRGSDSPHPTASTPEPTTSPSFSPLDLATEFLALDIPPLPSKTPVSASTSWSQQPSIFPTILPTPHLSKEPTLSPLLHPSQINPTVMPTDNPSMRPSPSPISNPTFPPR